MKNKIALLILICASLTGCQTWNYITKEEPAPVPESTAMVTLPIGWTQAVVVRDRVMATRDGIGIQFIEVIHGKAEKVFKDTDVTFKEDASPEDAAKSVVSYLKASAGFVEVDVLENTPARLAGEDAFKLHLTFKNEKGVRFERLVYGFVRDEQLLMASYQAPNLHFFERDLSTFEETLKTISI